MQLRVCSVSAPECPAVFNSITAGEEIQQQMEKLRRLRQAKDNLSEENLSGVTPLPLSINTKT